MLPLCASTLSAELPKAVKGAVVPALQSTTISARIVVGSSKVDAAKSGGVTPNELGNPVTMTGTPAVEFVKSNAPVSTTYRSAEVPVPTKSNGAAERPPSKVRLRFKVPDPAAVTKPDAVVVSRRICPALASKVAFPEISPEATVPTVATPKASITEPTDTCCGPLISVPPCPNTVTRVLGPMITVVVPPRKVSVPSAPTRVASSIATMPPLRANTIPDTRSSNPAACTLLPANTCVAVNNALGLAVVVAAEAAAVVVGAELAAVIVPYATAVVPLPRLASCPRPTLPVDSMPLTS